MANFDKIKAMKVDEFYHFLTGKSLSVEDMALELSKKMRCSECPCHSFCRKSPCEETLTEWLKRQEEQAA